MVTRPVPTGIDTDSDREMLRLLRNDVEVHRSGKGYIDAIGEHGRANLRRDQGMFRFSALPPIYERLWRPSISRMIFGRRLSAADERRIALEMLSVAPGDRVIDIGCGPGNYTRRLAMAAGKGLVVGVDASEAMISAAAKRGGESNLTYMRGDACALPFEAAVFDAACSVGVIHMVDDPLKALDEMTRVLAPGGRLVVVATCEKNTVPRVRGQMTAFGRDDLTGALAERGLIDVTQRIVGRGQFISARKSMEK